MLSLLAYWLVNYIGRPPHDMWLVFLCSIIDIFSISVFLIIFKMLMNENKRDKKEKIKSEFKEIK